MYIVRPPFLKSSIFSWVAMIFSWGSAVLETGGGAGTEVYRKKVMKAKNETVARPKTSSRIHLLFVKESIENPQSY